MKLAGPLTVLVSSMLLIPSTPAWSIPAFARKYHTTCARCHSVVPRLNNYGWNFKLRGFQVPGDEEAGKIVTKDDPFLSLIKDIPLGVRATGRIENTTNSGMNPDVRLNNKLELLFGDTLAPRLGTFVELEAEKHDEDNSFDTGIGNVRLMFTDLIRREPTALNLEVGRFNLDEFSISDGRKLSVNPYAIYDKDIGLNSFHFEDEVMGFNVNGAFFTGLGVEKPTTEAAPKTGTAGSVSTEEMKELQNELNTQPAAATERPEVVAARATFDVMVKKGLMTQDEEDSALTNLATRLGPAPTPPAPPAAETTPVAGTTLAKTDYDIRKGLFYQAGIVTPGIESNNRYQFFGRLALAGPQNWWISPYLYTGQQGLVLPGAVPDPVVIGGATFQPVSSPSTPFNDEFRRYGVDLSFSTGPHRDVAGVPRHAFDLQAAIEHQRDDSGNGPGLKVDSTGGFVEGAYLINDRNLALLRWDRLSATEAPGSDTSTLTANYTRYLRRNVKIGGEYVFDVLKSDTNHQNANQWFVFYDFAF